MRKREDHTRSVWQKGTVQGVSTCTASGQLCYQPGVCAASAAPAYHDPMSDPARPFAANPLHWFPEYLTLSRRRLRSQARLTGSAVLVGVVAGLGAVLFAVACQAVVAGSLDAYAGYRPAGPKGEAVVSWIPESLTTFRPWL